MRFKLKLAKLGLRGSPSPHCHQRDSESQAKPATPGLTLPSREGGRAAALNWQYLISHSEVRRIVRSVALKLKYRDVAVFGLFGAHTPESSL